MRTQALTFRRCEQAVSLFFDGDATHRNLHNSPKLSYSDIKSSRGLYPQMGNNRWKWMAGATAATAAGVTASEANAITINLLSNYISAFGVNHLNTDLTGDGHQDLTISGSRVSDSGHHVGIT